MSLRVLLADESPSIKKAFDLALKDFAVTVQTVHQGTDVLELFNSFKPDICFLDVLLPKKNGYEACTDIKQHVASSPVVLMWSNFMEVDEGKFSSCGAVDRIEKPFETKTLRAIVLEHVPKTKQNKISEFLEPVGESEVPALNIKPPADLSDLDEAPPALDDSESDDPFSGLELSEEDDDLENFQMEPLENFEGQEEESFAEFSPPVDDSGPSETPPPPPPELQSFSENDTDTTQPSISEMPPLQNFNENDGDITEPSIVEVMPPAELQSFTDDDEVTEPSILVAEEPIISPPDPPVLETPEKKLDLNSELTKEELKRLVMAQSKDIIESVVWEVVPELAKEMIKKEIERLTGELNPHEESR